MHKDYKCNDCVDKDTKEPIKRQQIRCPEMSAACLRATPNEWAQCYSLFGFDEDNKPKFGRKVLLPTCCREIVHCMAGKRARLELSHEYTMKATQDDKEYQSPEKQVRTASGGYRK